MTIHLTWLVFYFHEDDLKQLIMNRCTFNNLRVYSLA